MMTGATGVVSREYPCYMQFWSLPPCDAVELLCRLPVPTWEPIKNPSFLDRCLDSFAPPSIQKKPCSNFRQKVDPRRVLTAKIYSTVAPRVMRSSAGIR